MKHICIVLFTCLALISCDGSSKNNEPHALKAIDKKTLVTMVKQLHQALNVKKYSLEKGLHVLKPYLSKYKVCIPGFSEMVPYDESYLYIYCIYDTKTTPPRVLSFKFQLPNHLVQQLTLNDIKKQFQTWQLTGSSKNPDNTTSNIYNAGAKNISIDITQQPLPNQKDSTITQVIVYH